MDLNIYECGPYPLCRGVPALKGMYDGLDQIYPLAQLAKFVLVSPACLHWKTFTVVNKY